MKSQSEIIMLNIHLLCADGPRALVVGTVGGCIFRGLCTPGENGDTMVIRPNGALSMVLAPPVVAERTAPQKIEIAAAHVVWALVEE